MVNVFFSYSHADETLRDMLEVHLSTLKRQGTIAAWHDRRLVPGSPIDAGISDALETANVILFLVSADFIASDYCYTREMDRALERHAAGEAAVLPVILRPCDWHGTPMGKLLAAPTDGKPITTWADRDEAMLDVVRAIRRVIDTQAPREAPRTAPAPIPKAAPAIPEGPRSSNMRVRKEPTRQDHDVFMDEAFDYIRDFVRNSLEELDARHEDIGTRFRAIDADRFTGTIYRGGEMIGGFTIFRGGHMEGIMFSGSPDADTNGWNESLHVESGETGLYLRPMGMSFHGGNHEPHLSARGAAEMMWDLVMSPLQR